jgi:hypothetical protein
MMISNRLKSLLFLALVATASSCAWGYSGEEGKVHTEPQAQTSPTVVEFKDSPQADDEQPMVRQSDAPQATKPQSPCGVSTFVIRRYDADGVVEKTIDCLERKAVNVKRMPISNDQFQEAQSAGLPEGAWYILVDPKGLRAKFLSNVELIKISKHFDVEYLQKDRHRDLLIYEYRDAIR